MDVRAEPFPTLGEEMLSGVPCSSELLGEVGVLDLFCRSEDGRLPVAGRHKASCGCTWCGISFLLSLACKTFSSTIVQSSETLECPHAASQEILGMRVSNSYKLLL